MTADAKFYKIKLIKKLLHTTEQLRKQLFDELILNATDPVIIRRRVRMIKSLNLYENQLIEKIQSFETDDINDIIQFDPKITIQHIINRSA